MKDIVDRNIPDWIDGTEYPKMQTLYKREDKKGKIIEGEYSDENFTKVDQWMVQEKVDGTNIRICLRCDRATKVWSAVVMGRDSKSIVPNNILQAIENDHIMVKATNYFNKYNNEYDKSDLFYDTPIVLYGEGYGKGVQADGDKYRPDNGFILFDIKVGDKWIPWQEVLNLSSDMGLQVPPILRYDNSKIVEHANWDPKGWTMQQAIDFVKSKPKSLLANFDRPMEGIIARQYGQTQEQYNSSAGFGIRWKLKARDFKG